MGTKRIINNTAYSLSISLTVRRSETSGEVVIVENFSLKPGEERVVEYGGDDNSYLDAITVEAIYQANIIDTQERINWHSDYDDHQLNTYDNVPIDYIEGERFSRRFRAIA